MATFCPSPLLGWMLLAALGRADVAPAWSAEALESPPAAVSSATPEAGSEALASYYAKRFNGRRTSSGERHRPEAFTAAHPTLPFGTKVKVVHLGNLRETIVTINDRCRRRKVQVIDLSRAAARQLGLLRHGRARVRIVPLPADALADLQPRPPRPEARSL